MSQNARSHRKLKIAGVVALVLVVALLGFAGNFLFDFALNPQAPYTMKMMQDGKDDKKGEQPDAEETEARAWFKENRESRVDFQSQRNSLNGPRVSAASATRK